jgi:cyclopropane fatty-acyl-phospholipid synthase-like methyltransferase
VSLKAVLVRQFGRPSGLPGRLAGHVMARRTSNRLRNFRTVELMRLGPATRVVEIGCGPGLALRLCAEVVTEGRILALDHSPEMIAQSAARLGRAGLGGRVELVVGGPERLTDWPCGFDRAFSLNVIQFIPDKAAFFARLHDALAPGGLCFTTYQPRLEGDEGGAAAAMAEEVTAAMAAAGFGEVTRTDIEAGGSAALCISGRRAA